MAELNLRIENPSMSLRARVVREIRRAIAEGALSQGERITEQRLIELTGVSRTSVREALCELESQGLMERGDGRTLRVATLDLVRVEHIYEVRLALEPTAIELFTLRATDAEVEALAACIPPAGTDPEEPQYGGIFEFDELVLRGCRNPVLAQTLDLLHTRIDALRRVSLSIPGRRQSSVAELHQVVSAIQRRSPEHAAKASRQHILAAREAARQAIAIQSARLPISDDPPRLREDDAVRD